MMGTLWRSKWNLARLAVALLVLAVLTLDAGPRLARMQLAALPGFDYAAEVARLRGERRYGEALMVAEAGAQNSAKRKSQSANP